MLELINLCKDYSAGGNRSRVLKNISLQFRQKEFAAILGPSGCGKTTLLNIIGGLDHDFSGNLRINGRSTEKFGERNWDHYRNHSVGFVFQSYNLIPHQTVLQNVELALTLSGIPRHQRRKMALRALAKVGLSEHLRKKPCQMSGGQMQRVAIARAIVNEPDIILADEPTGALDTATSIQVMELLKEISKDRLVIMVTHNPELASRYATRTIRMLDGEIVQDSNPMDLSESVLEQPAAKPAVRKRSAMSFSTAFALSVKNLMSKKTRTALTAFAGSIGIIGIAMIFAISQGAELYIRNVQEETLSAYPLTIDATIPDMSALIQMFMDGTQPQSGTDTGHVSARPMMADMVRVLCQRDKSQNNLQALKDYLEQRMDKDPELKASLNGIAYGYGTELPVYTRDPSGTVLHSDSGEILSEVIRSNLGMELGTLGSAGTSIGLPVSLWTELLPGKDGAPVNPILYSQYDLVHGKWPEKADEILLVLDEHNQLEDLTLFALGLRSKEEMDTLFEGSGDASRETWTYEDLSRMDFRVILPENAFAQAEDGRYVNLTEQPQALPDLFRHALPLHICGIIRPNCQTKIPMLSGTVCYTHGLTEYLAASAERSPAVQAQLKDKTTDLFTGLPFPTAETAFSPDGGYSSATLDENLKKLGYVNLEAPASICFYAAGFDGKAQITDAISDYNQTVPKLSQIRYTDYVGLAMRSVSAMISAITRVLIGLVGISLLVSSIMIGVITLISVQERTKEIGILRSMGASKSNISALFNAETVIIGLLSGGLGVGITALACGPLNKLILRTTGISGLQAHLSWQAALVLIGISVILTVLSGALPARSASGKDPVAALRCES